MRSARAPGGRLPPPLLGAARAACQGAGGRASLALSRRCTRDRAPLVALALAAAAEERDGGPSGSGATDPRGGGSGDRSRDAGRGDRRSRRPPPGPGPRDQTERDGSSDRAQGERRGWNGDGSGRPPGPRRGGAEEPGQRSGDAAGRGEREPRRPGGGERWEGGRPRDQRPGGQEQRWSEGWERRGERRRRDGGEPGEARRRWCERPQQEGRERRDDRPRGQSSDEGGDGGPQRGERRPSRGSGGRERGPRREREGGERQQAAPAERAPGAPPLLSASCLQVSNGGVTPSPEFLWHLNAAAGSGEWHEVKRFQSRLAACARESGRELAPAHYRALLAATARALRIAAARVLTEAPRPRPGAQPHRQQQQQQQEAAEGEGEGGAGGGSSGGDAAAEQAPRITWRRPWWDQRQAVRPAQVLGRGRGMQWKLRWPQQQGDSPPRPLGRGEARAQRGPDAAGGAAGREGAGAEALPGSYVASELDEAWLFVRFLAAELQAAGDDALAAAASMTCIVDMGWGVDDGERSLNAMSRKQLGDRLSSLSDAGMRACEPATPGNARLLLGLHVAAARAGLKWRGGARTPGTRLGDAAVFLGAGGGMALLWAWTRRGGEWTPANVKLLYAALQAAPPPAAVLPYRAAVELELLAGLVPQPPPPRYVEGLCVALRRARLESEAPGAPAAEGGPPSGGTRAVTLLGVASTLAGQRLWAQPDFLADAPTLVLAVSSVLRSCAAGQLSPQQLVTLLRAVNALTVNFGYQLPQGMCEDIAARVQAEAPSLHLSQISKVATSLVDLGIVPPRAAVDALLAALAARLQHPSQGRGNVDRSGESYAHIAAALPLLGCPRGAAVLAPLLRAGCAALQSGSMPPHLVVSFMRGLAQLAPHGGLPRREAWLLVSALPAAFTRGAAAARARGREGDHAPEGAGSAGPRSAGGEGDAAGGSGVVGEEEQEQRQVRPDEGQGRRHVQRRAAQQGCSQQQQGWAPWHVADALEALNEAVHNTRGSTELWAAARELVEATHRGMSADELARVAAAMCASEHRGNQALLDTLLLPALEPHLAALAAAGLSGDAGQEQQQQEEKQEEQQQQQEEKQEEQQEEQQRQEEEEEQEQKQEQGQQHEDKQQEGGAQLPGAELQGSEEPGRQRPERTSAPLSPERLAALLPAMASAGLQPRGHWWALYQEAAAAALPGVDVWSLAELLAAAAALRLPARQAWADAALRALTPERAAKLGPGDAAAALGGLAHLADAAGGGVGGAGAAAFDAHVTAALWRSAAQHVKALTEAAARGEGVAGAEGPAAGEEGPAPDASSSGDEGDAAASAVATASRGLGAACCDLLRSAGRLQRARADLGPPAKLLQQLLRGSRASLEARALPPAEVAQLARSVEVLGLRPSAEWVGSLEDCLEAQLDAARPADLARVVTSLVAVGAHPRLFLLQRLLEIGPSPAFSPDLMGELHRAVTTLLADPHERAAAAGRGRRTSARGARSSEAVAAAAGPAGVPGEGAEAEEFDAFVDAARAQLGAGALPEAGSTESTAAGGEASAGAGLGSSGLWQFVSGDSAAE